MKKIFYSASLIASLMLASCSRSVDSVEPETTTQASDEFGACYPQCTDYVRDYWLSGLPRGLFTYSDKKKICNAWSPVKGYAAIMAPNHIAYVSSVSGNNVTIKEANWDYKCGIATRTIDKSKIYGYWKP
jgi:hypothetical protein